MVINGAFRDTKTKVAYFSLVCGPDHSHVDFRDRSSELTWKFFKRNPLIYPKHVIHECPGVMRGGISFW